MNPKFTALEWSSSENGERIVASMTLANFEQSCLFIETITNFVLQERTKEPIVPVTEVGDEKNKTQDRLHEALQQLVDYVKDGCPDDGRYYVMAEAQAALKGIQLVSATAEAT